MRSYRAICGWLLVAALTALAAGCGGGQESQSPAAAPESTVAALRAQAQALAAAGVTPQQAAGQLMDFGEAHFPQFFPGHKITVFLGPFAYRFYGETGIYLGVVVAPDGIQYQLEDVYVMGGPFGGAPKFVAPLSAIMTPVGPPSCDNTPNAVITFSPCSLSTSWDEGVALAVFLPVTVTPTTAFAGTVFARVDDPQGIVSRFVDLVGNGSGGVRANLNLLGRDFGVYQGAIAVHLCRDASCESEFEGSPLTLPYLFTVRRSDPLASVLKRLFGPAGAPRTVPLMLRTNRFPQAGLFVRITDDQGQGFVANTTIAFPANSGFQADFDVPVSIPNVPGIHSGSFTATVCRDAACLLPVPGSAQSFAYSF
jgi:hypothetical protein